MNFYISPEEQAKIDKWLYEVIWPREVEKQRGTEFEGWQVTINGHVAPYTGATGGELEYCFFPTSLGTVIKVKHPSGDELDVTDYASW